jgi:hypothetical protein
MIQMSEGRVTDIRPEGARLWALGGWGREIKIGDVITAEDEEIQIEVTTKGASLPPMGIVIAVV